MTELITDHVFRTRHGAGSRTVEENNKIKLQCDWLGTCHRLAHEHAPRADKQMQKEETE